MVAARAGPRAPAASWATLARGAAVAAAAEAEVATAMAAAETA